MSPWAPILPLLGLILPGQVSVAAEQSVISGTVMSARKGRPIPGAVIRVIQSGDVALGDDLGNFTTKPQPPGLVTLEVIASGYHVEAFSFTLEPGKPLNADLKLQKIGGGEPGVIIIEERRDTVEPVVRTITVEELQRIPGTFGDAVRSVQNLPGVSRSAFGLGNLIIRGTEPEDTGIYVDGVKVPLIFHFGGLSTTLNSDVLDRVDFIPGGFTARYGRNLGGVVDVATKDYIPLKRSAYADIDLLDTTLFLTTPVGENQGLTFSVRRSYADLVLGFVLDQATANNESGREFNTLQLPVYEDYQVMWDYHLGDEHRFHVSFFGSRDRFSIEGGGGPNGEEGETTTAELETTNTKLVARWTYVPTAKLSSKFTFGMGPDANTLSVGPISIDTSPYSLFLREDLTYEVNSTFTLRGGLDGLFQWYAFDLTVPDSPDGSPQGGGPTEVTETTDVNSAPIVLSPAIYAETDVYLGPVTLTPGLRMDPYWVYDTESETQLYTGVSFDPRLNARWRVGQNTAIKGSLGRYSNGVQPFALMDIEEGTEPPDLEWAYQTSLGFEQRFTKDLGLSATGFWNEQRDLLVTGNTPGGSVFGADGAGFSRGLEALLRHDPGEAGFFGWISYTLSQAKRVDDFTNACDRNGEGEEGCSPWYSFDYDQTHIFTAVASQRLKRGWEIGMRFQYTTGNPYTPQELAYYDFDEDSYIPLNGATNSERLPAFHQLDLRVDKRWIKPWGEIDAKLELINVYNRANPESVQYSYDYSETSYVSGLPFFPSFGLKVAF